MVLANDECGQILLSGAFLFAVTIALIAVMLSNVLYTNNVAYFGFSEMSIYDESSYKHMIIDEMNYEYNISGGNEAWFTSNMTTFMKTSNNMTLTKGIYIKNNIIPDSFHPKGVRQQIDIYGKNFNMSFIADTNYIKPLTSIKITVDRDPGKVIVKLGFVNTSNIFTLIADVTNSSTYMPEPSLITTYYFVHNGVLGDGTTDFVNPYTDENGRNIYKTGNLPSGSYDIYAIVKNSQCSNNITFTV